MTTAREEFTARKLADKYGVVGRVAGLYVSAGYSVRIRVRVGSDVADVVASKEGSRLAIIVAAEPRVYGRDLVEKAKKLGDALKARPVIVLYGAGPRLSGDAVKAAEELGVSVRRVRP